MGRKEFEIVAIALKEIAHIYIEDGTLHYQSLDGQVYSQITRLEEMERFAQMKGFCKVERGYLAQTDKIVYYNPETHNAYYEDPPARKGATYTPIGRPYVKLLEEKGIMFATNDSVKSKQKFIPFNATIKK